jgi:hypothetical protein
MSQKPKKPTEYRGITQIPPDPDVQVVETIRAKPDADLLVLIIDELRAINERLQSVTGADHVRIVDKLR